ncbi:unnamed protein product [Rotaria socialis]|uniref:Uncharacterized protein n=1 Tax=Rotaria socialis TaxID=392032 RepID=A0A818P935_9BILA|nr:unnamed protein product [Rotaria socialis]CAF3617599.1 unnamed protein product [Rotaria socialis]CAF4277660.1 unnamed protein product [Rotaria socialis]CAF4537574.1 unnamed protein product [Rotaria socialis]
MLSSRANPTNGDDSAMPGDYGSLSVLPRRNGPISAPSPELESMVPTSRTPFPRIPAARSNDEISPSTPFSRLPMVPRTADPSMGRRVQMPRGQSHRRRRRPLTPEIVIEPKSRCRSSWGRRRVITIPWNNRPTLGLRGPPETVIEIERIPCRRRRRHHHHRRCRPVCCEYECDDPPPQPTTIITNPIGNPYLLPAQPSFILPTNDNIGTVSSTYPSNLTAEMLENLPRQTVHLPPIHLPGSQADDNTELDTIVLPAEIINPADGTLSAIQANAGGNFGGSPNMQSVLAVPNQSFVSVPNSSIIRVPNQSFISAPNSSIIRVPNQSIIAAPRQSMIAAPNQVQLNNISRAQTMSPTMAADPLMQRFQNLFQRLRLPQAQSMPRAATNTPMIRPMLPSMSQNIPMNNTDNRPPPTVSLTNTANSGIYPSANIRPANPLNNELYRSANMTSSVPTSSAPYAPANITPYRPSTFTPSTTINNPVYRPASIAPSNSSAIGPYRSANITPYSNSNLPQMSSFAPEPTPYTSAPSVASSRSFAPFPTLSSSTPSTYANNYINSQSLTTNFNQTNNGMPKSILRNGTSNTTYTRLATPNISS